MYHGPKLPPLAAHIWTWWLDLCATRPVTGMGVSPISRLEIQAWEADEEIELTPWERRTILRLDAVFRTAQASDG
ncbi:phage tail assembly chaperone [Caulobacter ginsengisoli]|uniref:phage tail assembly chaperone n=1 Tax=Caulobacter ginsengisoli TaxID=400775 RepID=UPI003F984EEC